MIGSLFIRCLKTKIVCCLWLHPIWNNWHLICSIKVIFGLISGVMVRVLAKSVVDGWFKAWSGQTKHYEIDLYCFSAKHTALRRKRQDWFAQNQNNVSEWNNIYSWTVVSVISTIKIQLILLLLPVDYNISSTLDS